MKKYLYIIMLSLIIIGCNKEPSGACNLFIYDCSDGKVTEEDTCKNTITQIGTCNQCAIENVWFPVNDGYEPQQPFSVVKSHICTEECMDYEYSCEDNAVNLDKCGQYLSDRANCCCTEADREIYQSERTEEQLMQRFCTNTPNNNYYCDGNNINRKECGKDKGKYTQCASGTCEGVIDSQEPKATFDVIYSMCKGALCHDTDEDAYHLDGLNPEKKGITTSIYGYSDEDVCHNNSVLIEFYCPLNLSGASESDKIECKCKDGVCETTPTFRYQCTDEDGKDITKSGKLTIRGANLTQVDKCVGDSVWEYYCNNPLTNYKKASSNNFSSIYGYQKIDCDSSQTCAGGACLKRNDCTNISDCEFPPCLGVIASCKNSKCKYKGDCKDCITPEDCNDQNEKTTDECINNKCRNTIPEEPFPLWIIIGIPLALTLTGFIIYFIIPKKRRR